MEQISIFVQEYIPSPHIAVFYLFYPFWYSAHTITKSNVPKNCIHLLPILFWLQMTMADNENLVNMKFIPTVIPVLPLLINTASERSKICRDFRF